MLVAVFDNRTGDTTLQSLGRMTQDWIAQGILRMNLVDLVDPRAVFVQGRTATGAAVDPVTLARRTGAAMVISGSYYRTGGHAASAGVDTGCARRPDRARRGPDPVQGRDPDCRAR